MAVWDDVLGDTDRKVFEAAGWGRPAGFGARPAMLVIDVNYNFCGDRPEPILESIKRWRYSCGERGWEGVAAIARSWSGPGRKRLPIIYTTNPRRPTASTWASGTCKSHRAEDDVDVMGHRGNEIVDEVAPLPGDLFIEKRKPSAFFGTPLISHLINLRADSLICHRDDHQRAASAPRRSTPSPTTCGSTSPTSASSTGRCCPTRWPCSTSTEVRRRADSDDVLGYLDGLEPGLFDAEFPALRDAGGVAR